jgi:uncharacterized protein YjbI with pentapeptide repeats
VQIGGQRRRLESASTPVRLHIRQDWPQTLTAFAGIVSVLLVAAGLIYTNDANRKQQQATQNQTKITEQGQLTDRFSKAVEQLGQEGPDKLGIRLGGIYALERLMADSPRDEPTIIEVLCAFVRTHALPPAGESRAAESLPPSSPDVYAVVTVLGRRPSPADRKNARLDFAGARIAMPHAGLTGANLSGANLSGANLSGADLRGATLRDADLRGGNLRDADLRNANLGGADLGGADLRDADLRGADLGRAELSGADLRDADLRGADLSGGNLRGANLSRADLSGARLRDTNLRIANLNRANLSGANLFGTDLTDANLRGLDLRGADLSGANFGVVVEAGELAGRAIQCAWVDDSTRLPPGVARPMPEAPLKDPACR